MNTIIKLIEWFLMAVLTVISETRIRLQAEDAAEEEKLTPAEAAVLQWTVVETHMGLLHGKVCTTASLWEIVWWDISELGRASSVVTESLMALPVPVRSRWMSRLDKDGRGLRIPHHEVMKYLEEAANEAELLEKENPE